MTAGLPRLTLLIPDDWYRLPLTDDEVLRRAVAAVVDRQFRGIDNQPLLRREATDALLRQGRSARDNGGVDLYLSHESVGGIPLAVSLVVSLVPLPPGEPSLHAVARELALPGATVAVVDLPAGGAVRRQRVDAAGAGELGAPQQESVLVDYALLGPAGTMLLLSFSSPIVAVADALAELFEAVAGTVRWSA